MAEATVRVMLYFNQETWDAIEEDALRSNMRVSRMLKLLVESFYESPRFRWNMDREALIALLQDAQEPPAPEEATPEPATVEAVEDNRVDSPYEDEWDA